LNNIILGESNSITVTLHLSDTKEKLRSFEHFNHRTYWRLHFLEHFLCAIHLIQVSLNFLLQNDNFILQWLLKIEFLLVWIISSFNNSLDLLFDFLIAFFQQIIFGIQHVHIVEKTIVLLLRFYECCNYFFDVWDAGCLLNLVKCIFNYFNISQILVHQFSFFFVCFYYFIQSPF